MNLDNVIKTSIGFFAIISIIFAALFAGCTNVPSNADRIYSASYVGDRRSVNFEEVIAAVPGKAGQPGFINVHVSLSGIINPRKVSLSDVDDAQSIVWRLSPRISSAVVAVIQEKTVPLDDISVLRDEVLKEANRVLMAEFSKWTSAENYDVHIAITSLYLTDGSVGRGNSGHSRWGW